LNSKAEFIRVLQDVQAKSPPMVDYIASHAAPECRIDVLADAAEGVWPAVVDARRFAITFRNVAAYTGVHGIDEPFATALITAGVISTDVDDDESDRRAWAIEAINAYEAISDPAARVDLIASLKLAEPLAVSEIQPQDGPVYGLLLQEELLADTPDVYTALAHVGAMSRESFIAHSTNFVAYVSPEQVEPDHVAPLLTSSQIPDTVKLKLVSFLPALGSSMQRESAQAIADWAVQSEIEIPVDGLQVIAQAGTKPATVIRLLRPNVATATADQLAALLNSMGQPYSDLAQQASVTTVIPTSDENNELHPDTGSWGTFDRL
jgi:hypothetical protein